MLHRNRTKAATRRHLLALLDNERGSDLILLPEMWPVGYFAFSRYRREAETIDGPTIRALRTKARELEVYLLGVQLCGDRQRDRLRRAIAVRRAGGRGARRGGNGRGSAHRGNRCFGPPPAS
jgi:predicted amidohydrolase